MHWPLLESHHAPVVTAIDTDCDVSVCLDFYRHPLDGDPDGEWENTALGDLVHDAKYRPQGAMEGRRSRSVAGGLCRMSAPIRCSGSYRVWRQCRVRAMGSLADSLA